MRKFEFTGDWTTVIELDQLSHLDYDGWGIKNEPNSLVELVIDERINVDPYPTPEQIATIEFVMNNQAAIYQSIFKALKEVVYPHWETIDNNYWDDDDVPSLETIEDTRSFLGLTGISLKPLVIERLALTTYHFDCHFDNEHGLSMVFHGDKFLGYGEAYNVDYEKFLSKEDYTKLWAVYNP